MAQRGPQLTTLHANWLEPKSAVIRGFDFAPRKIKLSAEYINFTSIYIYNLSAYPKRFVSCSDTITIIIAIANRKSHTYCNNVDDATFLFLPRL